MRTREAYVAQLKNSLDAWNEDVTRWEAQARSAKADMKKRYERMLQDVHARREEAQYQLKLLQAASASAWSELERGTDTAWESLRKSVEQARTHFEKR